MNAHPATSPEGPSAADANKTSCRRCGTCCQKGGPAFHLADRELIESGRIPARLLFTIRAGEPVWDNVAGRIHIADTDIVKLRGTDGTPACVCHDPAAGCTIYADRPLECRVLDCRDTAAIAELYRRDRLTRNALFQSVPGLWRLIADHQEHCGYEKIRKMIPELNGRERDAALVRLSEILEMDRMVREEPVRRGLVPEDWTGLLFGRPLPRTLIGFGLQVTRSADGFLVRPASPSSPGFQNPSAIHSSPIHPSPSQGDAPCSTFTNC
jgi:Fe-S-cluster containining protein